MGDSKGRVSFEGHQVGHVPDWAAPFVAVVEGLRQRGHFAAFSQRVRVARRGGYTAIDVFLFVLLSFLARLDGGFGGLSRALRSHQLTERLGAFAGRRRMPTQPAVSRFLKSVTSKHLRRMMPWLLVESIDAIDLIEAPHCLVYDGQGRGVHVFDFDGKVKTVRRRGLPDSADSPEPTRLDESLVSRGFAGRKRGELQMCRQLLQHAGSGLWIGGWWAPGNGDRLGAALEAVELVGALQRRLSHHALIRFDGAYPSWQLFRACERHDVGFLVRWTSYAPLYFEKVKALLDAGEWNQVEDSGSGPTRYAQDAGQLTDDNGQSVRLTVSRHRTHKSAGAGTVIDGWRYELFVSNMAVAAWSADQVVTQYFARAGQENRFGQEQRELDLDRLFSECLPGQAFVSLIGLFVWNLQTVAGWRDLRDSMTSVPPPSPRAEAQPEAAPPAQADTVSPLLLALDQRLDWSTIGQRGFTWNVDRGLRCRNDVLMKIRRERKGSLIFIAPRNVCNHCELRQQCSQSRSTRLRREVQVPVLDDISDVLRTRRLWLEYAALDPVKPKQRPRTETARNWSAPSAEHEGGYAVRGPFLAPAECRRAAREAWRSLRAEIAQPELIRRSRPDRGCCSSAAQRQRRRRTWRERDQWNALPPSPVKATLRGETPELVQHLIWTISGTS